MGFRALRGRKLRFGVGLGLTGAGNRGLELSEAGNGGFRDVTEIRPDSPEIWSERYWEPSENTQFRRKTHVWMRLDPLVIVSTAKTCLVGLSVSETPQIVGFGTGR